MRPSTILKVVAAVVGGVVLLFGLVALVAINSLRDPPFDPPEVAPLAVEVEIGTNLGVGDTLLRDGVMYVAVRDQVGTRLNVVDPRTLRILFGFGVRGAVRLPGHTTSTDLLLDGASRLVVVTTTIDRGHAGERLHVLRFAADGTPDLAFGGRVRREGRDVLLEQGVDDALVDASGRIVVLGGDSTLVRLDAAGELDPTFGDQGVAQLRRSSLCELPPANRSEVCRGA